MQTEAVIMNRIPRALVTVVLCCLLRSSGAEDMIVYTANQGWLSRVYALRMDGTVITYHEYEYYIFSDLEVVGNEVYVTDWVAPRLYKVDALTGDLDVAVDDWSLLSMYDVAWDGAYFYIDEWSLNRYDIEGNWQGSASFSESIRGSACDGEYYWTLDNDGLIQCWDISAWPTVVEIPGNAFLPPTPFCKGLWFDEQHFWSAESKDTLGKIYRFDYEGHVVSEWTEPAFSGYAACVVPGPMTISGTISNGELTLEWIPYPGASAYWIYGSENSEYFLPEIPWPHSNRVAVVPPETTSWASPAGVGIPEINWTYLIVAVDGLEEEIATSNRIGELDFGLTIPTRE
jgi:hypothetical protein